METGVSVIIPTIRTGDEVLKNILSVVISLQHFKGVK